MNHGLSLCRPRRTGAAQNGAAAQRRLSRRRRRPDPRRKGHRQEHGGSVAGESAADFADGPGLPVSLRSGCALGGMPALLDRDGATCRGRRGAVCRFAVRGHGGPRAGHPRFRAGHARRPQRHEAGFAGQCSPRRPLYRRGEFAARPSCGCAPRRRRRGHQHRAAGKCVGGASVAFFADRHDESGGRRPCGRSCSTASVWSWK